MLVTRDEATKELIEDNNLVGVIEGTNTVNIIKNRYNGVTGKVPIFLYKQLEEEFEGIDEPEDTERADEMLNAIMQMVGEINQGQNAEQPEPEVSRDGPSIQDILAGLKDETVNPIENAMKEGNLNMDRIKRDIAKRMIKKAAEEKINQGKEAIYDIGNTLGKFFTEVIDKVQDTFEEVEPRVEQATQDIKDTFEQVGIRANLAKLRAVRDFSVEQNVATKGFLKKINARIAALETY